MSPFDIGAYQWKDRLLLVFTPCKEYAVYETQRQLLDEQLTGLNDRALRVIEIFADSGHVDGTSINEAAVMALRDRFDVDQATFQVVLVGKDGTEKERYTTAVEPKLIVDTIDAMPMRQREMQRLKR